MSASAVRELREGMGLSMAWVARLTLLPVARVEAYENGELEDEARLLPVYQALHEVLRAANRVQT